MKFLKSFFSLNYIFLLILCYIGGFIELYSLEVRGAFAGLQTGNLIYIFVNTIKGDYYLALYYFLLISCFVVGVIISQIVVNVCKKRNKEYKFIILFLEITCLIVDLIIPVNQSILDPLNILGAISLSLFCGLQIHSFIEVHNHLLATTMVTAMIRSLVDNIYKYITQKTKENIISALSLFLSILSFTLGAITFSFIDFFAKDISSYFISIPIFLLLMCLFLHLLALKKK